MLLYEINTEEPEPDLINEVAALLKAGKIVAYPTDTLYGLGADAFNREACHRVAILKGRDESKPFPYIMDKAERLAEWGVRLSPLADAMARRFWPGPVSLVVSGSREIPAHALDSAGNICVRVPESIVARAIAGAAKGLIIATSANPSGHPASRSAREVADYFRGEIAAVVDGGESSRFDPSTILDVSRGKVIILREGAVPAEEILAALGQAQAELEDREGRKEK